MIKYIFCLIALIIQLAFAWYVYHKQDKRKAALKMPMIYFSGAYLLVQLYVFFKFCIKIPESYQIYSYLLQGGILLVFIFLELALFGSNKYISNIQQKEQDSIRDYKNLIKELEICRVTVTDPINKENLEKLYEKMRYEDPVSSEEVAPENAKIYQLIMELSEMSDCEQFAAKCKEIEKQLDIRKIKNTKVKG